MDNCTNGLVNYRDGRFCETHLGLAKFCGIISCGRHVWKENALTCDKVSHKTFYEAYIRRFGREGYHTVHPKFNRRTNARSLYEDQPNGITHQVMLPEVDGTPGTEIIHNFRARKVHCTQTFQWTCGVPIAWGKCYTAESLPQVYDMMSNLWPEDGQPRPAFLFYNNACSLL